HASGDSPVKLSGPIGADRRPERRTYQLERTPLARRRRWIRELLRQRASRYPGVVVVQDRDRFGGLTHALLRLQRHFDTGARKGQEHPALRPPSKHLFHEEPVYAKLPDVSRLHDIRLGGFVVIEDRAALVVDDLMLPDDIRLPNELPAQSHEPPLTNSACVAGSSRT